jgi:NADH-quinone oxidoreductase subunit A
VQEAAVNPFVPIIGLAGLAAAFAVISLIGSKIVGPARYNRARLEAYECGIEATPQAERARFPIKYYLTGMMFIIFDIEIVFLYPWAVHFDALGLFGFYAMALFLVLITVAYVYEWRRGGLDWD